MVNYKQGRNELCNCGSGKKFKHCCGNLAKKQVAVPIMTLLAALVDHLGGAVNITNEHLKSMPPDLVLRMNCTEEGYVLRLVKKEKPLIQVPEKRLIV